MRLHLFGALFAAIFLSALPLTSASAQAIRTWVSGVGDDFNPCSRTAPCKTFAGAISKTATSGEINCLDPGGFGAVTITQSISIVCGQSGIAGVLVAGTPGITVNVSATSRVVLDGLDFEGAGSGTNGVAMNGAGQLTIRNCSIRDFASFGVVVAGTTPRVLIQNSLITGNLGGINVQGTSGANEAVILNSLIDSNTNFGLEVSGSSTVVLSASTVTGNATGIIASGGANVISYGNNVIRNGGTPTSTMPLQ
jgi:hypothetical protein